ncbi:MAG TPA: hypothetical protein VGL11_24395 [Candidatus Binatia bacterium]
MSHRERLRRRSKEGRENSARSSRAPFLESRPSIEIRIEELALNGFQPADRYRIGAALENELTRMLTEQGMPQAIADSIELTRLDAGEFLTTPGEPPSMVGNQVARAVYRGLEQIDASRRFPGAKGDQS